MTFFAVQEPTSTAVLLAVFGVLMLISVLFSRPAERLGVPVVLVFLLLGMLAGSEGIGGVAFEDYQFAFRIGTAALVFILFDGGLNTPFHVIRRSILPASLLATVGVVLTAGLVALIGRLAGLGWPEAMLLGAVVSSTDAAAVFSVLRGSGLTLHKRVGTTLELESGLNDPVAVILTVAMTEAIVSGQPIGWSIAVLVPIQLLIGGFVGLAMGYFQSWLLTRVQLRAGGLYPVLTLGAALATFGAATLINGSGFLAVYVCAVVMGNRVFPYRDGLRRIHDAIAWLGQISMFLMLGLLVFPSRLLDIVGIGLGIALFLAFIARPLAVWLCLLPFRYPWRDNVYIGWVGLRGAIPIILATFPVMAGASGAERIFDIVFFVVVVNALLPGATVRWATRLLKLEVTEPPAPSAVLEIHSTQALRGEIRSYFIDQSLAVCGAPLSSIRLPQGSSVVLVVRGSDMLAARGATVLQAGDHVYVFCQPDDRPYVELLFGRSQQSQEFVAP